MTRAASTGAKPRRTFRRGFAVAVSGALLCGVLTVEARLDFEVRRIVAALPAAPNPASVPTSTVVVDRNGHLLRPFTTAEGRWRLPVEKESVDPRYLAMLVAYEDRRFAGHGGVDWRALMRAAVQFALSGHIVSGGSTLTMQVARLLEGDPTRRPEAKLRQIVHARELERSLTKDQILDLYLTLAPFGGNIEGVRAATLAYFGKEPNRLTAAEAALLVALPQSPEARRPDRDAAAAKAARDRVLDRLAESGALDPDEANAAKGEPIPRARRDFPVLAAHLAQQAVGARPEAAIHQLTIDRDMQASLERLAAKRTSLLGARLSIAIVMAEHATGAIRASIGSAGLFKADRAGYVDMTRALRSPGSTLKPFIYGLAFEEGLAHPETLIDDRPTGFEGYVPVNFDGSSHGTVTIRKALTESLNVPAVVALDAVGSAALIARLKRAGANPVLPGNAPPGLAIGLGGVGISLRELVGAYAALAHGGQAVALHDGARDASLPRTGVVLDRTAAWYVSDILSDVPPPVTGSPGQVAYKTGTSYGYRDAWAIGFDGAYVIGVWVGRPDGAPVPGLSGFTTAAPILFEAFDRIGARRVPLPAAPAGAIADVSTAGLPLPLRRFRKPGSQPPPRDPLPEIAFPRDGVHIDLGMTGGGRGTPLVVKVRNGAPPFTFLANGVPFARSNFARAESYAPDGPGFVTIAVIDGKGHADRVTIFVE